jgi:hypothetical protein
MGRDTQNARSAGGFKAMTTPSPKAETGIDDATVDMYLDLTLRASGSALRHYSTALTIERMRIAVRAAMNHKHDRACHKPQAQTSEPRGVVCE